MQIPGLPFPVPMRVQAPRDSDNPRPDEDDANKTERQRRKDKLIFIPRRCENAGCGRDAGDVTLSKCKACSCVMYCSKECQRADWKRHKIECSHLVKLGLWGCPYDPKQEDKNYPNGGRMSKRKAATVPKQCGICGSTTEKLMRAPCCGNWVCDNEHKYQMMSYSRQFCGRSHSRYTACGHHYNEGHKGEDWRDCHECKNHFHSIHGHWFSTNGYCFTPGRAPPKGYMHTTACCECNGRVHTGHEGYSMRQEPMGIGICCQRCGGFNF